MKFMDTMALGSILSARTHDDFVLVIGDKKLVQESVGAFDYAHNDPDRCNYVALRLGGSLVCLLLDDNGKSTGGTQYYFGRAATHKDYEQHGIHINTDYEGDMTLGADILLATRRGHHNPFIGVCHQTGEVHFYDENGDRR